MSPLTPDPVAGTLLTSSTDIAAPFSSSDTENQYSPSTEREIILHHGTTYTWSESDNPDELENVNRYRPGVWLARNALLDGEYVALKILTADASKITNEHNIGAHLQSNGNPQHPGYAYVASSLGWFSFSGPNGRHVCLVGEVVGCDLERFKDICLPTWTFPIETSRAIAAQVILGLTYLHSLGLCHGDLNLNNILLQRPFQGLSVEDMYKQYYMPYKIALHRADNAPIGPEAPSYLVHSMPTISSDEITNCQTKISDFSLAFMVGHEPKYASTTLPVSPAEALFDEKFTISVDIWSLGCTLFEIVGAGPLFWTFAGQDGLIRDMVHVLGPFPGTWWERWEPREKFFTEDGRRVEGSNDPPSTLEHRLSRLRNYGTPAETSAVSKAESPSLKALLSVMLVYKPFERISFWEGLNSDYVKNWAEPALVEALGKGLSKLLVPPSYEDQSNPTALNVIAVLRP